jgi:hypothetical protein
MIALIISLILIITLVTYTILSTKQTLTVGTTTSIVPTESNTSTTIAATTVADTTIDATTIAATTTTQKIFPITMVPMTISMPITSSNSVYKRTLSISSINYLTHLNSSNVITISFTIVNITNSTTETTIELSDINNYPLLSNNFKIFFANTTSNDRLYIGFYKNFYSTEDTVLQLQQKFWSRNIPSSSNNTFDINIQLSNFNKQVSNNANPLNNLDNSTPWNNQVSKFCNITASYSYMPIGSTSKITTNIVNQATTWYDNILLKYMQYKPGSLINTGITINNFKITIT